MAKRVQQDSGEERVTAKSRAMMSLIARAPSNSLIFSVRKPGREAMEIRIPGVRKLRKRIERCNPLWAATQEPRLAIFTNNLLKAFSQHATQSGMITKLGLLKSGKLTNRCNLQHSAKAEREREDRTGQPIVTFWGKTHESQSSFFHEKTQHDGTGLSVVNDETPHD